MGGWCIGVISPLEAEPQADTVLLEIADVFEYRAGEADSAMAYLRKYLTRQPDAQTAPDVRWIPGTISAAPMQTPVKNR